MDSFPWYHCDNYESGCRELLQKDDYEDHVENCIFRKVNCAALDCYEEILSKDVAEHIKMEHRRGKEPTDLKKRSNFSCTRPNGRPKAKYSKPTAVVASDGTVFYVVSFKPSKILYFWLYVNASPKVAKHYEYSLTFSKDHDMITFKGQPHSMDKHFTAIVENEEAFCVGEKTLERYTLLDPVTTMSVYSFKVEIRCLKTEAKDEDVESGVSDVESDRD